MNNQGDTSVLHASRPDNRRRGRKAAHPVARLARAEGVDVLHVQNKHMLVPGVLARALTGRPVLLTIRDGSLIDAAPVCLHHHDRRPPDCGVAKLWRECSVEYKEPSKS